MGIFLVLAVVVGTFGLCFLVDKGFTKVFRGQAQHRTGLSVRLNKHYGGFGLVLAVLGLAGIFSGLTQGAVLIAGGCLVMVVGIALVVYYMTFGVFYDEDSFVLTTFGRRSQTYYYRDIRTQQLYNNGGTTLIELHLSDGRAVQLQASMIGVYPFLDKAFAGWLRQTGRRQEDCAFYDPDNSCWFPPVEG